MRGCVAIRTGRQPTTHAGEQEALPNRPSEGDSWAQCIKIARAYQAPRWVAFSGGIILRNTDAFSSFE